MDRLTPAEVRRHEDVSAFSASMCPTGWVYSWVHTRGRVQGAGDGGKDLVLMHADGSPENASGFPDVLLSGCESLSGAIFSPNGSHFLVQTKDALLVGDPQTLQVACILKLQPHETFVGLPVWVRAEHVLFGTSGGNPKRQRLFSCRLPALEDLLSGQAKPVQDRQLHFVADHGASLMSWDHSQAAVATKARVAVIHRLANAMYAEIVVCAGPEGSHGDSRVVAIDARVEYCKPRLAFLSGGQLLMRLNLPVDAMDGVGFMASWISAGAQRGSEAKPVPAKHGLWILEHVADSSCDIKPIHFVSNLCHGSYDVCSGAYGKQHGVLESFVLDTSRNAVVTTVHRIDPGSSHTDELWLVRFNDSGFSAEELETSESGKGCYVPVACNENQLIYHYRSPKERGDLWLLSMSEKEGDQGDYKNAKRCKCSRRTRTMPRSLQQKLLIPSEVQILGGEHTIHALLFTPDSGGKLQPLLWLHGGPMAQYSWDYNPLLSWLASLGYMVLAPNYAGSTGSGIEFMDKVLADGCGRADLADCLSCAKWLKNNDAKDDRLDLSRGVAVGGHSWGGYLAFMCMLQGETAEGSSTMESVFSCGIATAGIADWKFQQRHTEVRYYDYALMGGWVYDSEVMERARNASPKTHATDLRAPMLILHGEKDIDVPFAQIPPFVDALRRSSHSNAEVEYHSYPGEGHGISGSDSQADYLKRVETFLRINLKPWDFTDNPHGELTAY